MTTQNEQDQTLDKIISPVAEEQAPETEQAASDNLENEIKGKPATSEQFQIPDKFKGKSAEDIVKSYVELERDYGRRGNELGEIRKVNDQLLGLQLDSKAGDSSSPAQRQPVTSDELLSDPDSAINRVLNSNERLDTIEKTLSLQTIAQNRSKFEAKHADWQDVMSSPEFAKWLQASPVRTNLFNYAHKEYDYEVGGELLDLFKEGQTVQEASTQNAEQAVKTKNKKDMDAMSMEKGSTGERKAPVFYREDIIQLRINNEAEYNRLYPEIFQAYKEGRVKNKRK